MTHDAEQVLTAALGLPYDERVELIEVLVASVHADQPPFDEGSREVIQRRSAELASGEVASTPWAEVERQTREAAGP